MHTVRCAQLLVCGMHFHNKTFVCWSSEREKNNKFTIKCMYIYIVYASVLYNLVIALHVSYDNYTIHDLPVRLLRLLLHVMSMLLSMFCVCVFCVFMCPLEMFDMFQNSLYRTSSSLMCLTSYTRHIYMVSTKMFYLFKNVLHLMSDASRKNRRIGSTQIC